MPTGDVRSGAWRGLAACLGLSGTKNVQSLQVEPAQPVQDMDALTRYGSGLVAPGSLAIDDGWQTLRITRALGASGFATQSGTPYGDADNRVPLGSGWVFWIYDVAMELTATADIDDASTAHIRVAPRAVVNDTDAPDRLIFAGSTARLFRRTNLIGFYSNFCQPRFPLPVPRIADPIEMTVENNAAAGSVTYEGIIFGRYLPAGVPPTP